jgi:hypothetical protein
VRYGASAQTRRLEAWWRSSWAEYFASLLKAQRLELAEEEEEEEESGCGYCRECIRIVTIYMKSSYLT